MKEVRIFRHHIYKHLQQDWNDVLSRVVSLWSPRVRSNLTPNLTPSISNSETAEINGLIEGESDETELHDDGVLVGEEELIQLWLPGNIVHIYARRGVYNAVLVPRSFTDLRRILVQGNIFRDHSSMSIFESLQEVIYSMNYFINQFRFVLQGKRSVTRLNGCLIMNQNVANVVRITLLGIQLFEEKHNNIEKGLFDIRRLFILSSSLDIIVDPVVGLFVVHVHQIANLFSG